MKRNRGSDLSMHVKKNAVFVLIVLNSFSKDFSECRFSNEKCSFTCIDRKQRKIHKKKHSSIFELNGKKIKINICNV